MGKVDLLGAALVLCAAFAVNIGCVSNGFLADDQYLAARPFDEGSFSIADTFTSPWGSDAGGEFEVLVNEGYYRPLSVVFFEVQRAVFGKDPLGFHVVNLVLNALAALLVFFISRRWLQASGALAAGLIFACHGVHSEPVNAVFYQTTLLSGVLIFAAVLLHTSKKKSRVRSIATVCIYSLAVFTKETAIILPLLLAIHDLLFEPVRLKSLLRPIYGALFVIAAGYMAVRFAVLPADPISFFDGATTGEQATTMVGVFALYWKLLLWPYPLCPFYEWSIAPPLQQPTLYLILGVIALAANLALATLFTRRAFKSTGQSRTSNALAAFALFLIPASLLPVSHIIPFLILAAERFLYIGSFALAVLLGLIFQKTWTSPLRPLRLTATVLIAIYLLANALISHVRTTDWTTDESLARATVRDYPNSLNAHLTLTKILESTNRKTEALEHARKAAEIAPNMKSVRELEERLK